jgi:hypothetical protein
MMRQAQRDLQLHPSSTFLVDGADNVPQDTQAIWGTPNWTPENSWFRTHFADIHVILSLTEAAHREVFVPNGIAIDYLHIDADHHYAGVRRDFDLFAPLVREGGVITLHDVSNYRPPCGVPRLVQELRSGGEYAIMVFPVAYGTAVLKKNPR